MFGSYDFPAASYDAWKTRCPDYDWEEPEFECHQCMDTGFEADDDRAEPCRYCSEPCDDDDAVDRGDIDTITEADIRVQVHCPFCGLEWAGPLPCGHCGEPDIPTPDD